MIFITENILNIQWLWAITTFPFFFKAMNATWPCCLVVKPCKRDSTWTDYYEHVSKGPMFIYWSCIYCFLMTRFWKTSSHKFQSVVQLRLGGMSGCVCDCISFSKKVRTIQCDVSDNQNKLLPWSQTSVNPKRPKYFSQDHTKSKTSVNIGFSFNLLSCLLWVSVGCEGC